MGVTAGLPSRRHCLIIIMRTRGWREPAGPTCTMQRSLSDSQGREREEPPAGGQGLTLAIGIILCHARTLSSKWLCNLLTLLEDVHITCPRITVAHIGSPRGNSVTIVRMAARQPASHSSELRQWPPSSESQTHSMTNAKSGLCRQCCGSVAGCMALVVQAKPAGAGVSQCNRCPSEHGGQAACSSLPNTMPACH